jgi:D-glycero-alpha-D-manno-heptose-7-phosphate kinase
MIQVTKQPLRISLAGGSTDLQEYLNKYDEGAVISFTPNLYTYIIMKKSSDEYYKIVYSNVEKVLKSQDIKNDIAREVLSYFDMPPVEVIFTADIPSSGSGLASSSSYMVNMIKACLQFMEKPMSILQVGKLAIELERKFNPLTGYQDTWGCLLSGFKSLLFNKNGFSMHSPYSHRLFDYYDFYLVPTGVTRSSTNVLETIDCDKVHVMAATTLEMNEALQAAKYDEVAKLISRGWVQKKLTSPSIMNEEISKLEDEFTKTQGIVTWRLIGAGAGGYFLVLAEKGTYLQCKHIKIDLHNE